MLVKVLIFALQFDLMLGTANICQIFIANISHEGYQRYFRQQFRSKCIFLMDWSLLQSTKIEYKQVPPTVFLCSGPRPTVYAGIILPSTHCITINIIISYITFDQARQHRLHFTLANRNALHCLYCSARQTFQYKKY